MKRCLKTLIVVIAMSIILVSVFSGCKSQSEEYKQDQNVIRYTVMLRLDRQNIVYYQLARQVEDYILGDRDIEEEKFKSFCLGINCFIRDELKTGWHDLYQHNEKVFETTKDLVCITAKNEMEMLRLSELSDNNLEQLIVSFDELADCCDRAKENSFAYFVENQNFEGDLFEEELNRVQALIMNVDEITKVKGENT